MMMVMTDIFFLVPGDGGWRLFRSLSPSFSSPFLPALSLYSNLSSGMIRQSTSGGMVNKNFETNRLFAAAYLMSFRKRKPHAHEIILLLYYMKNIPKKLLALWHFAL